MANKAQKAVVKFNDNAFVQQLISLLMNSGQVKVDTLGIFEIKTVKAREGYSIKDGSRIIIPEHKKVAFRPTAQFKLKAQEYKEDDNK